jgi:hypothetical protein
VSYDRLALGALVYVAVLSCIEGKFSVCKNAWKRRLFLAYLFCAFVTFCEYEAIQKAVLRQSGKLLEEEFLAVWAVLACWASWGLGELMLRDQYSWFGVLLAVAVAASALQASASFLGGWLPSWEHCEAGTSLCHPHKRRVYVPCEGRSSKRPGGWMAWKASWETLGLLEWDYELVSCMSR